VFFLFKTRHDKTTLFKPIMVPNYEHVNQM